MKNHDIAKEWFKMAEIDFDSAKFLLTMKPVPFDALRHFSTGNSHLHTQLGVRDGRAGQSWPPPSDHQ